MEMNGLCPACMQKTEKTVDGKCRCCGFNLDGGMETAHHQLKPFTILNGKYLVGKVLGEGGFGITYIGYDMNLEIRVAIKEFYPNGYISRENEISSVVNVYTGSNLEMIGKWKNNFLREARILAKFSNLSGIVAVRDFFQENNTAYIVMEYLDGMTLKEYAKSLGGRIAWDKLLQSLQPVFYSLKEIHKNGLIHRDISPDNIMVMQGGGMKLLDFGAARDYGNDENKSLSVVLKPGYAPEEQYRSKGKQGPWTDIYAMSATIYRCVTGVTPPESMERLRKDELNPLRDYGIAVPPKEEEALMKGMAVFAEERFQTMNAFYEALYPQVTASFAGEALGIAGESIVDSMQEPFAPQNPTPMQNPPFMQMLSFVQNSFSKQKLADLAQNTKVRRYFAAAVCLCLIIFLCFGMSKGKKTQDTEKDSLTDAAAQTEDIQDTAEGAADSVGSLNSVESAEASEIQEPERTNSEKTAEEVRILEAFRTRLPSASLDGIEYAYALPVNDYSSMYNLAGISGVNGVLVSEINDLDKDGQQELITIRIEEDTTKDDYYKNGFWADIYEIKDEQAVLQDSIFLFNCFNICDMGRIRVFLKDDTFLCADVWEYVFMAGDGQGYEICQLSYDGNMWMQEVRDEYAGSDGIALIEAADYYKETLAKLDALGMKKTTALIKTQRQLCFDDNEEGLKPLYVAELQNKMNDYMRYDRNFVEPGKVKIHAYEGNGGSAAESISYNYFTEEDYQNNLDYMEYGHYSGDNPYFHFGYPVKLYNRVYIDRDTYTAIGGVNQVSVSFYGKDWDGFTKRGSYANFAQYIRNDSVDMQTTYEQLLNYYSGLFTEAAVLKKYTSDFSAPPETEEPYHCRFVVTGYRDNSQEQMIYLLVTVWNDCVQMMWVECPLMIPGDKTSMDYWQKSYYIENMYRMCGFSNSTHGPRTFEEFMNREEGE